MTTIPFPYGRAICYSGFREGQRPGGKVPSYHEVVADLRILEGDWKYLRLYDCDPHAETVLEAIHKEGFPFQVMLGAYIVAEESNPNCPWEGAVYSSDQLDANRLYNAERMHTLLAMADTYAPYICSISVGNEACVDWTDHLVPVERVVAFAKLIKSQTSIPVTFCENYVPWLEKLKPLAEVVDFISIHTYPVWEYKSIHEAMDYTKANLQAVADANPGKPIVITEAGWTTNSNGRGIDPHNANQCLQKEYIDQLIAWADAEQIITFVFEAFDEPWKGSPDPLEPEKHWGLYTVDRKPKLVAEKMVVVE